MKYTKEKLDSYCGKLVEVSLNYEWEKFKGWLVKASSCPEYSYRRSSYILLPLDTKYGRQVFSRKSVVKIRKMPTTYTTDTYFE